MDTACSSALVALDIGLQYNRNMRSPSVALVFGVNTIDPQTSQVLLTARQLSSRLGRCATFDESADGYVRGEACAGGLL